mgnify:CR=1 FL=1|tara:strand:- start:1223 stop:1852 length:630 start_codon:yes stop_codon:yes gene_type:complete
MRYQHIKFPAGELHFEGVLSMPESSDSIQATVLCHPHPLRGGNMDNHVITAIGLGLDQIGIANLRFNFRGVGNSEGEYSDGELEYKEIIGAQNILLDNQELSFTSVSTLGYSFGSRVILKHSKVLKPCSKLVLVSPQTEAVKDSNLKELDIPVLIIAGSNDHISSMDSIEDFIGPNHDNIRLKKIQGADHFWIGHESELIETVVEHLLD